MFKKINSQSEPYGKDFQEIRAVEGGLGISLKAATALRYIIYLLRRILPYGKES